MTVATMSDKTEDLFTAFIKAQSEFLHVSKETDGNRGKFAKFPDVVESTRPVLNQNGLGITQLAQRCEGGALVVTKIVHASGQWFSDGGMFVPAAKLDPQGTGSALSYAKRYAWLAVCGVATDDDDGAAALQGLETEKRVAAKAATEAAIGLTAPQKNIIRAIMSKAGFELPESKFEGKLAEDYPTHLRTAIDLAVKEKALAAEAAPGIATFALALNVDAVTVALEEQVAA